MVTEQDLLAGVQQEEAQLEAAAAARCLPAEVRQRRTEAGAATARAQVREVFAFALIAGCLYRIAQVLLVTI